MEMENELCRGDDSDSCSFSNRPQISKRDAVLGVHMVDADTLFKKCALNDSRRGPPLNTLWTGDADLRLYITTVQDG